MTEYEKKLDELFTQLVKAMQNYECAMRVRAFPNIHMQTSRLDESRLQIDLNNLALEICNLIEEITCTFNVEERLENVEKFSRKIQLIGNSSVILRGEIHAAKDENTITDEELQSYDNVLHNLHCLDETIKKYNSTFKVPLITFEKARKYFNEKIDEMFNIKKSVE